MSNIESTKDGLVEVSTGRKIESPLDLPARLKPEDHAEVFILRAMLAMARHSLCPPTYEKFCHCYNELLNTRRLPLEELD